MNLEIKVDDNKKVSATLEGRNYSASFEQLTPLAAVLALEEMIEDARLAAIPLKKKVRQMFSSDCFHVGASIEAPVPDEGIKSYRVQIARVCKELGIKVKTKLFEKEGDEYLKITRIS